MWRRRGLPNTGERGEDLFSQLNRNPLQLRVLAWLHRLVAGGWCVPAQFIISITNCLSSLELNFILSIIYLAERGREREAAPLRQAQSVMEFLTVCQVIENPLSLFSKWFTVYSPKPCLYLVGSMQGRQSTTDGEVRWGEVRWDNRRVLRPGIISSREVWPQPLVSDWYVNFETSSSVLWDLH